MTVLPDPLTMTFHDAQHGTEEKRWIFMGCNREDLLLVVAHTFVSIGANSALLRLISARGATRAAVTGKRFFAVVN